MTTPPVDGIPVNLSAAIQEGPDGGPWIAYSLTQGLTQYTLVMPVGTARQMPDLWHDVTQQVLASAQGPGLIVPGLIVPK